MVTDYRIDVAEVLRYLGAKPDKATEDLIRSCAETLISVARPQYVWKEFTLDGLKIVGSGAELLGKTAATWLEGCDGCAFLAATLGIEADMLIRRAQNTDMARAVVYDACATDLIEKVCDRAQDEIKALAESEGLLITDRFSPGYGDFPIEFQRDLCNILDITRRLGICLTDNFLLTPTKSVTAVVGIGNPQNRIGKGCRNCNMKNHCKLRGISN